MRPALLLLGANSLLLSTGPAILTAQGASPAPTTIGYADASLALRFGTLGFGLELSKLLAPHFAGRVGANYFKYSTTKAESDITYDATAKLQAVSVLFDLYPAARGAFHFTGGLMTNPLKVEGAGVPENGSTFTLNDHDYTAAQVGTLVAKAKFPGASPYVGLGWGTPARKNGRVRFVLDLGAAIGKAKVTLNATGAANNAALASDLRAQQDKTRADVDKYGKAYPVVQAGLLFKF